MRKLLALSTSVGLLGVLGTAGVVASAATANGPTIDQLMNAGWTCFRDPGAPRMVCSDPGHGRPSPTDPSPPPTFNFKIFTLEGAFVGTVHLIRSDLYRGQPCPPTGAPYFPIPAIGYHRCEHF